MRTARNFDTNLSGMREKIAESGRRTVEITDLDLVGWLLEKNGAAAPDHPGRLPVLIDPTLHGRKKFRIVPSARRPEAGSDKPWEIDLSRLALPGGSPLPPLVFRNCRFLAPINIGGSIFAAFRIEDCEGEGLLGIGSVIEGNLTIRNFRSPSVRAKSENTSSAIQPTCRVRLSGARIGGAADFCKSELSSDAKPPEDRSRKAYADQFALALNEVDVGGRVLLADGFTATGGVTLFQAHVERDVMFDDATIEAHWLGEDVGDPEAETSGRPGAGPKKRAADGTVNYAALDAKELRCGGGFIWRGEASRVHGRIELSDAHLGGDLVLHHLVWPEDPEVGRRNGGLDCRRITIGGQLAIKGKSEIARRIRRTSSLEPPYVAGLALDLWKAHIDRGILIEEGTRFYGTVMLNQAKIGHELAMKSSRIEIEGAPAPLDSPFLVALDCRGAVVDGSMSLDLAAVTGRVSLEAMQIAGHVDLEHVQFDLTRQAAPRYTDEGEAGDRGERWYRQDGLGREVRDSRRRFDRSSLLDMQDMTIRGGVNLRRCAISLAPPRERSPNHYIVDLRGLTAESWDDAEATCWTGLETRGPHFGLIMADMLHALLSQVRRWWKSELPKEEVRDETGIPWRIRFDGISFQRLETSSQKPRIKKGAIETWRQSERHRLANRTYTTLSDWEAFLLRIAALDSYFCNRNKDVGRARWMLRVREGRSWWLMWLPTRIYRQTLDSQWQRRERMPQLRPQPYEIFAKAYIARGEVDVASRVLEHKLKLFWRRRMRSFSVRWMKFFPFGLALCGIGYGLSGWLNNDLIDDLAFWSFVAIAVITAAPQTLVVALKYCFGFGLGQKRAIVSLLAFATLAGFSTPMIMEGPGFWWSGEWRHHHHRHDHERYVAEHFFYGLDKMLPVVSSSIDFYAAERHSGVTIEHQHHIHEHVAPNPNWFAWLDMMWELLGWIIFTATAFTLSGFVRRDIER